MGTRVLFRSLAERARGTDKSYKKDDRGQGDPKMPDQRISGGGKASREVKDVGEGSDGAGSWDTRGWHQSTGAGLRAEPWGWPDKYFFL